MEPLWIIVAIMAIACVLLWPIRAIIAARYGRDDGRGNAETPLAPPKRRHRG